MKKTVGHYKLGRLTVKLEARSGDGGEAWFSFNDTEGPLITVGIERDEWWAVVDVLIHEAMEVSFCLNNLRFLNTQAEYTDHSDYLFVMTHSQWNLAGAQAAKFITAAMPDLAKVYNAYQKKIKVSK